MKIGQFYRPIKSDHKKRQIFAWHMTHKFSIYQVLLNLSVVCHVKIGQFLWSDYRRIKSANFVVFFRHWLKYAERWFIELIILKTLQWENLSEVLLQFHPWEVLFFLRWSWWADSWLFIYCILCCFLTIVAITHSLALSCQILYLVKNRCADNVTVKC